MAEGDQHRWMRHPALARDPNPGFQPGPGGLERQVTGLLAEDPADGRNDVTLVLATGQHITQPQKFAARTPLARLFPGWIKSCGIVFAGLMGCLHAVLLGRIRFLFAYVPILRHGISFVKMQNVVVYLKEIDTGKNS